MKIICTTERFIDEKESCKKEYCCNEMKEAMEPFEKNKKSRYASLHSNFSLVKDDTVELLTHRNYDGDNHYMKVKYCLFCGKLVSVEREKVDNGLPPKEMRPIVAAPPKKRHWWQR